MISRQGEMGWVEVGGHEYEMVTHTRTGLRTYWLDHNLVYTFPRQMTDNLGHKVCDLLFVRMMLLKLRAEGDAHFIIEEHDAMGGVTVTEPIPWRGAYRAAHTPKVPLQGEAACD